MGQLAVSYPDGRSRSSATAGRRGRDEPGQVFRASWGNQGEASVTELNRRELMLLSAAGALQPGATAAGQAAGRDGLQRKRTGFSVPPDYLREPEHDPRFLGQHRTRRSSGSSMVACGRGRFRRSAAVPGGVRSGPSFYGRPRVGKGTTTFSGSLGYGDVRAWLGPDYARKVYLGMASVHGGEFEGIVGIVNLIAVLETGADLRGRAWPGITAAAAALDRIILIPILNADGRSRVPIRMGVHRGTDHTVAEYFNTGGQPDGSLIGWPDCKEFIPLDFYADPVPGRLPQRRRRERPARRLLRPPAARDACAAGPGRRGAPGPDLEHAHRRDVPPAPAPLHRAGSHADLRGPLPQA